MSEYPVAEAKPGHNKPPVTPPFETDLLEDLKARYPNVQKKFDDLMEAAKTVPPVIEDDETAGKVQELLRNGSDTMKRWKADRGLEKGPWAKLADIAFGFFKDKEDKLDPVLKDIKGRHTVFLEKKAEAEERARQLKAEEERKRAEEARIAAEKAEAERRAAEEAKARAEEEERLARQRAEEAKQRQREAEEAAKKAAEEAKAAEAAKKAREREEREKNAELLKQIRRHMKDAKRLHDAGLTDETDQNDIDQLDALVRPGGIIGVLAAQVFSSALLDDEQVAEIEGIRTALGNMRQVLEERLDAKAIRKRARERKAIEEKEAQLAELREAQRKADEAAAEAARKAREEAEAAAAKAKEDAAKAARDARAAVKDANEAAAEVKEAARDAAGAQKAADKQDARAGRAERQVEGATDADLSRTRSELGTVGSLSGRWDYVVEDRDALVAYFGPLGQYLQPDAQDAAVYRYMRQHQGTFTKTPWRTEVPGVFFENVPESRIR